MTIGPCWQCCQRYNENVHQVLHNLLTKCPTAWPRTFFACFEVFRANLCEQNHHQIMEQSSMNETAPADIQFRSSLLNRESTVCDNRFFSHTRRQKTTIVYCFQSSIFIFFACTICLYERECMYFCRDARARSTDLDYALFLLVTDAERCAPWKDVEVCALRRPYMERMKLRCGFILFTDSWVICCCLLSDLCNLVCNMNGALSRKYRPNVWHRVQSFMMISFSLCPSVIRIKYSNVYCICHNNELTLCWLTLLIFFVWYMYILYELCDAST